MGQTLVQDYGTLVQSFRDLRWLLAHCEEWQNWTQSDGKDGPAKNAVELALQHIYLVALPRPRSPNDGYAKDELQDLRPFIIIDYPPPEAEDDEAFVAESAGAGFFAHRGRLNIRIEADVPGDVAGDIAAAKLDYMARVGRLLEDITDLSDTSGFMSIRTLRLWNPPFRSDEVELTEKGDFYMSDTLVHWGLRARQL